MNWKLALGLHATGLALKRSRGYSLSFINHVFKFTDGGKRGLILYFSQSLLHCWFSVSTCWRPMFRVYIAHRLDYLSCCCRSNPYNMWEWSISLGMVLFLPLPFSLFVVLGIKPRLSPILCKLSSTVLPFQSWKRYPSEILFTGFL